MQASQGSQCFWLCVAIFGNAASFFFGIKNQSCCQMSVKPIPEGFHTITPYLFAQGAARLIEFISAAFEGELIFQQERPDGAIMHATMQIGDSMLMLADSTPDFGPMPTSIYLYVADCDAVYHRALSSGGVSVFPIMTLPSGERYGGIKEPCGNS